MEKIKKTMEKLKKTIQIMDKPMKTMENSIETIEKNQKPVEKLMNSAVRMRDFSYKMQQMSDFSFKNQGKEPGRPKTKQKTKKKQIRNKMRTPLVYRNSRKKLQKYFQLLRRRLPRSNSACVAVEHPGSHHFYNLLYVQSILLSCDLSSKHGSYVS